MLPAAAAAARVFAAAIAFVSLALGPIGLIVLGVVAAIAALAAAWYFYGDEIKAALGDLHDAAIRWVKQTYEGIKQWMLDKLKAVWDGVKGAVEKVKHFFGDLYDSVVGGSSVPELIDGIRDWFSKLTFMPEMAGAATGMTAEQFAELQRRVAESMTGARDSVSGGAETMSDALARMAEDAGNFVSNAAQTFSALGNTIEEAAVDFVRGRLDFREMVSSMIDDLIRLGTRMFVLAPLFQMFSGFFGGSALNAGLPGLGALLPGFASGGSFVVGGMGGIDSQLVAFRATPGEMVTVSKDGAKEPKPTTVVFNVTTPHADSFRRAEGQIAAMLNRVVGRGARNL